MGKNNWRGSDEKYGDHTKTWLNRDEDGTVSQYNVKDLDTGDHYFSNPKTGASGVALSDYRPGREQDDDDDKDNSDDNDDN